MATTARIASISAFASALVLAISASCLDEDGLAVCSSTQDGPRADAALLQAQVLAQTERGQQGTKSSSMPLSGRIHIIETEVKKLKARVANLQIQVGMDDADKADFAGLEEPLMESRRTVEDQTGAKPLRGELEQVENEEEWQSKQNAPISTQMSQSGPADEDWAAAAPSAQPELEERREPFLPADEQGFHAPYPMALEEQTHQASKKKRPRASSAGRHKARGHAPAARKEDEEDDFDDTEDDEAGADEEFGDMERTSNKVRTHRLLDAAPSLLDLSTEGSVKKRRDESLKSKTAAMETEIVALTKKVQRLESQVAPELRYVDEGALLNTGAHKAKSKSSVIHSRIVVLEKDVDDLRTRVSSLEHMVVG